MSRKDSQRQLCAARHQRAYHLVGGKGSFKKTRSLLDLVAAAHEDVDGGKATLRPGVNAHVRFAEQEDTGHSEAWAEEMKMCLQNRRSGSFRRFHEKTLDGGPVAGHAGVDAIQVK